MEHENAEEKKNNKHSKSPYLPEKAVEPNAGQVWYTTARDSVSFLLQTKRAGFHIMKMACDLYNTRKDCR